MSETGSVPINAAIHVGSYTIALGNGSLLYSRKILGGSALTQLKTNGGRQRVTNRTEGIGDLQYVMWRVVDRYYKLVIDYGEQTVTETDTAWPGAPLPDVGVWVLYKHGTVLPYLDSHGVFEWPGMTPSKTRINNPTESQVDATAQDTYAECHYVLEFWWSSEWESYDPNTQHEAMLASCAGELTATGVKSRRYNPINGTVTFVTGDTNLVRLRCATELVGRGGYLWTRPCALKAWAKGPALPAGPTALLALPATDNVCIINAVPSKTVSLGQDIADGLPDDSPRGVVNWAASIEKPRNPILERDASAFCTGTSIATGGFDIVVAGISSYFTPAVIVATIEGVRTPAPVLFEWLAGYLSVGTFYGGQWREWLSLGDGTVWNEQAAQDLDANAELVTCSSWTGHDYTQVACGQSTVDGKVKVYLRPAFGYPWQVGTFDFAAPAGVIPYVVQAPNSLWELGWVVGDTWTRWKCYNPLGTWESLA